MKKNNFKNIFNDLVERLFPICRSLSGPGNRKTLKIIKEYLPDLDIIETPTGKNVFDWTIPEEWSIKDAYILDEKGNRLVDFKNNNLHVMGYSIPVNSMMSFEELEKKLFYCEEENTIPYKTSYYNKNWGFCVTKKQYQLIKEKSKKCRYFKVVIDSSFKKGSMTHGELLIKGSSQKEIIVSTYICHPSMYNDNISGIVTNIMLAIYLSKNKNKYSYRFLFCPETIGVINWLFSNQSKLNKIKCAFVSTCCGVGKKITYKKSKIKNGIVNASIEKALKDLSKECNIIDFSPNGSDERQFSSIGINIDTGSLMRSPYYAFKEYHTSLDNLENASFDNIWEIVNVYIECFFIIDSNEYFLNLKNMCEPMLGKTGLYRKVGGKVKNRTKEDALRWVLAYSDGNNSLLDIAIMSKLPFRVIYDAAYNLNNVKLIQLK